MIATNKYRTGQANKDNESILPDWFCMEEIMPKKKGNQYFIIIIFLLPAVLIYTTILIYPITQTIYQSFFSWNGIAQSALEFVGLDNYKALYGNKEFFQALANSGRFLVVGFVLQMPISFLLGLFITSKFRFVKGFKTSYFLPVVLPMTAVGIMWGFILLPGDGLFNEVLNLLGLGFLVQDWLGSITVVSWTLPMVNLWASVGLNMIIFSAGIVNIPSDIYEAAEIDGATGLAKIFRITIPLMKNTFKTYAILCITGCLKVFDIVFIMTSGGPNKASDVPATMLYYSGFKYQRFGLANSIGVSIFVLGLIASILINKFIRNGDD